MFPPQMAKQCKLAWVTFVCLGYLFVCFMWVFLSGLFFPRTTEGYLCVKCGRHVRRTETRTMSYPNCPTSQPQNSRGKGGVFCPTLHQCAWGFPVVAKGSLVCVCSVFLNIFLRHSNFQSRAHRPGRDFCVHHTNKDITEILERPSSLLAPGVPVRSFHVSKTQKLPPQPTRGTGLPNAMNTRVVLDMSSNAPNTLSSEVLGWCPNST